MDNIKKIYTSFEEYEPLILDKYNRFRYYMSCNNAMNPVVSKFLHQEGFRPKYKYDKKFAICISHDVDFLFENKSTIGFIKSGAKSIKNNNLKLGYYNFLRTLKKLPNPNWILDNFINFEVKNNIVSSYYFLSLEKGESDYNYKIEKQKNYFDIIQ